MTSQWCQRPIFRKLGSLSQVMPGQVLLMESLRLRLLSLLFLVQLLHQLFGLFFADAISSVKWCGVRQALYLLNLLELKHIWLYVIMFLSAL